MKKLIIISSLSLFLNQILFASPDKDNPLLMKSISFNLGLSANRDLTNFGIGNMEFYQPLPIRGGTMISYDAANNGVKTPYVSNFDLTIKIESYFLFF